MTTNVKLLIKMVSFLYLKERLNLVSILGAGLLVGAGNCHHYYFILLFSTFISTSFKMYFNNLYSSYDNNKALAVIIPEGVQMLYTQQFHGIVV